MTKKEDKNFETQLWVFTGAVTLSGGKPGAGFQRVVNGKLKSGKDDFAYFPSSSCRSLSLGSVYKVPVSGATWRIKAAEWQARFHDEAQVQKWEAASEIELTRRRVQKLEKEERRKSALRLMLLPIREEYLKTDRYGRYAIEVMLLDALRGRFG